MSFLHFVYGCTDELRNCLSFLQNCFLSWMWDWDRQTRKYSTWSLMKNHSLGWPLLLQNLSQAIQDSLFCLLSSCKDLRIIVIPPFGTLSKIVWLMATAVEVLLESLRTMGISKTPSGSILAAWMMIEEDSVTFGEVFGTNELASLFPWELGDPDRRNLSWHLNARKLSPRLPIESGGSSLKLFQSLLICQK